MPAMVRVGHEKYDGACTLVASMAPAAMLARVMMMVLRLDSKMGHSCRVVSQHLRSHRGPSFQVVPHRRQPSAQGAQFPGNVALSWKLATKIDQYDDLKRGNRR